MSDKTGLGDRMKAYEHAYRQYLPHRSYTLMRLDMRAAHTYLKNALRPFDDAFIYDMNIVAETLCAQMQGVRFAYTQSDEISLLLTDFDTLRSELFFGGNVAKLLSIPASLASVRMYSLRTQWPGFPQFDCRVWSMADPVEVANYFVWRQRDAVRNSIQMVGQHYFSPNALEGKNTDDVQEMLFQEHGVNWSGFPEAQKRGRVTFPKVSAQFVEADPHERESRTWTTYAAPHFAAQPDNWLAKIIPPLPSLQETGAEKAGRVEEWVTSDVVTCKTEFGDGYRECQRDLRDKLGIEPPEPLVGLPTLAPGQEPRPAFSDTHPRAARELGGLLAGEES